MRLGDLVREHLVGGNQRSVVGNHVLLLLFAPGPERPQRSDRNRCTSPRARAARSVADVIELITTDGLFRFDGGEWEVTNNIWLVGDDREVIVIDAAHDARTIVDAVHGRRVAAIALTHGHNDHINAAATLQDAVDAPILLHPADRMLWHDVYPA